MEERVSIPIAKLVDCNGEVYSRDNTPARWLSWSDVQEHRAKLGQVAPAW